MSADADTWFEVVGGRNAEIGQGWVILTPRGKYRAYALGTTWASNMDSRGIEGVCGPVFMRGLRW